MANLSLTVLLAWRYFRARQERGLVSLVTGFSIAGLMVGVAALIIAMAVFTGFRLELRQRIYDLESPLKIQTFDSAIFQWRPEYSRRAEALPGVARVVPYLDAPTIVFAGPITKGALVRGLDFETLADLPVAVYLTQGEIDGSVAPADQRAPALMGHALAKTLGLELGATFRAYEGAALQGDVAAPTLPTARSLRLVGLFQTGIEKVDAGLIFTSPAAARAIAGLPAGPFYQGAQVYLDDALLADRLTAPLSALLAEAALAVRSSLAYDGARDRQIGFSAAQHLQLAQEQEAALIVILSLIVIVAAFGVIVAQIMKVQEKSREIAVLRSFGASAGLVLRAFMLLGLFIGLIGSLTGLVLGLVIATNLDAIRLALEGMTGLDLFPAAEFRLAFLPSRPTFGAAATAFAIALLLTLLAVVYPAIRAARLSPAEALRYA